MGRQFRWLMFFVFCLLGGGFLVSWGLGYHAFCSLDTSQWGVLQFVWGLFACQSFLAVGCSFLKAQNRVCQSSSVRINARGKTVNWRSQQTWLKIVWIFFLFRVGEAQHPGPSQEWTLGTFNSSGVAHRADVIAPLHGDFWGMVETHLSPISAKQFTRGLQCSKSSYKYLVQGFPCPLRTRSSHAGDFTGVSALSKWPCRALPHSFPDELYQTSRLQVVGVCLQQMWITVGMLYGLPKSVHHKHPRFQTDVLLEALVDRVGAQSTGPRAIMGDFNWEPHELSQVRRLQDMGFVELQDLAAAWWNTPIQPTGRGHTRIDAVFVSRELACLLRRVVVDPTQWPDHALVYGVFSSPQPVLESFHWRTPKECHWPQDWHPDIEPVFSQGASFAYADFWHRLEQQASQLDVTRGKPAWSKSVVGRGQTLDSVKTKAVPCPIRKGRKGEINPQFYGSSFRFAQQFKQVRRLQAYVQLLKKGHCSHHGQLAELWTSIRRSSGFPGGFGAWYASLQIAETPFSRSVPLLPPGLAHASCIFSLVQNEVQRFEQILIGQRTKAAKKRRANDLRYVFQDCQREQPQKVAMLVNTTASQVVEVDHDMLSVTIDPPMKVQPDVPLMHQGRALSIIHAEPDVLWLEQIQHVEVGAEVRQTQVHSSLPEIFQAFHDEWAPRWNRINAVLPSQWDQIASFAARVLQPVDWTFEDWTVGRFRTCLRHKKRQSATGLDGITRSDLLAMPDSAIRGILSFYQHIESHAQWPSQLTVGVVSALEKTPNALMVQQFRPIVIYPMLYRTWSSYRAKQFLRTFCSFAPSGVRGGVPARQARSIWYEIALVMEHAYLMNHHCVGVVADLVKAFNCIPREPIWIVLDLLGCPRWFIESWMSFVTVQTGRFRVRTSLRPSIASDVGFPEGCALSVAAMALIDHLLDCWMQPIHPTIRVLSFVDDWQILHQTIHDHPGNVQALFDFVDLLLMKVDRRKSFVWATAPSHRAELRHGTLPVMLNSRDLGAHLNFCLRKGNKVLVDRIHTMGTTWQQLRSCLAPYRLKVIGLRMLAWPRAMHGISAVSVGPLHYSTLRTGALRGLRQDRIGANPVLHLPLNGVTVDPEGWVILQSIKDARELGHPDYLRQMVSLFAVSQVGFPANGPLSILVHRVSRIGWTITQAGFFRDDLGVFDLFVLNLDALKFRIAWAWPWIFTEAVSHRKDFQGLQNVDLGFTRLLLDKYGESDRIFLRCCLDGTMVTQKDRGHWEPESDGSCPYCHQPDGYHHRAWDCPWFQECRSAISDEDRHMILQMPQCVTQHAWALKLPSQAPLMQALEAIPSIEPSQYSLSVAPWDVYDLFTDGSCIHPRDPVLRLAGFAVCLAQPWVNLLDSHVVVAGHVTGIHQTAYRAELVALVHALQIAQLLDAPVRIWSDCKGVLDMAQAFQQHRVVFKANASHSDLWQVVCTLLEAVGSRVSFHRVFSHNIVGDGSTEVDSWATWRNNLVDVAAGGITTKRSPEFVSLWKQVASEAEQRYKLHSAVFDVFLKVAHKHSGQKASGQKTAKFRASRERNTVLQPVVYRISPSLRVKFGATMSTLIHQWWQGTGKIFLQRVGSLQWISFAQLFADFQMAMGVEGPVFHGTKWYSSSSIYPADQKPT